GLNTEAIAASDREYFLAVGNLMGGSVSLHFFHGSGSPPAEYPLPVGQRISAAALSRDKVILGFEDGSVALARKEGNEARLAQTTKKLGRRILRVNISANGHTAYALADGNKLLLWNAEDWKDFFTLPSDLTDPLSCAGLSPSGDYLLAGTMRGNVQLWDLERRELLKTFKLGRSFLLECNLSVEHVAFLPDNNRVRQGGLAVVSGTPVRWRIEEPMRYRKDVPAGKVGSEKKDGTSPDDKTWERPTSTTKPEVKPPVKGGTQPQTKSQ